MLALQDRQHEALREASRASFVRDVCAIVEDAFPELNDALDRCTIRRQIETAMDIAGAKGVACRANLCKFALLCIVFGMDFQENGQNVLHPYLSPDRVSDEDVHEIYAAFSSEL